METTENLYYCAEHGLFIKDADDICSCGKVTGWVNITNGGLDASDRGVNGSN